MAKSKSALRKIPTFKSEEDERKFWETADSTQYVDWSKAEVVRFPNLRNALSEHLEPPPILSDDNLDSLSDSRLT